MSYIKRSEEHIISKGVKKNNHFGLQTTMNTTMNRESILVGVVQLAKPHGPREQVLYLMSPFKGRLYNHVLYDHV